MAIFSLQRLRGGEVAATPTGHQQTVRQVVVTPQDLYAAIKAAAFVSKNQWRACFARRNDGTAGSWDCSEFAHETKTPFSKLPKRKRPAAKAKSANFLAPHGAMGLGVMGGGMMPRIPRTQRVAPSPYSGIRPQVGKADLQTAQAKAHEAMLNNQAAGLTPVNSGHTTSPAVMGQFPKLAAAKSLTNMADRHFVSGWGTHPEDVLQEEGIFGARLPIPLRIAAFTRQGGAALDTLPGGWKSKRAAPTFQQSVPPETLRSMSADAVSFYERCYREAIEPAQVEAGLQKFAAHLDVEDIARHAPLYRSVCESGAGMEKSAGPLQFLAGLAKKLGPAAVRGTGRALPAARGAGRALPIAAAPAATAATGGFSQAMSKAKPFAPAAGRALLGGFTGADLGNYTDSPVDNIVGGALGAVGGLAHKRISGFSPAIGKAMNRYVAGDLVGTGTDTMLGTNIGPALGLGAAAGGAAPMIGSKAHNLMKTVGQGATGLNPLRMASTFKNLPAGKKLPYALGAATGLPAMGAVMLGGGAARSAIGGATQGITDAVSASMPGMLQGAMVNNPEMVSGLLNQAVQNNPQMFDEMINGYVTRNPEVADQMIGGFIERNPELKQMVGSAKSFGELNKIFEWGPLKSIFDAIGLGSANPIMKLIMLIGGGTAIAGLLSGNNTMGALGTIAMLGAASPTWLSGIMGSADAQPPAGQPPVASASPSRADAIMSARQNAPALPAPPQGGAAELGPSLAAPPATGNPEIDAILRLGVPTRYSSGVPASGSPELGPSLAPQPYTPGVLPNFTTPAPGQQYYSQGGVGR